MAEALETPGDGEGLRERRHRHWHDRLMMLCDGVFAIAITFLAAEVRAPDNWPGDWASLWSALGDQLDAYAMSFLVISVYWLAHRRFMTMIVTVDAPVTVLSLAMLGLIALLPAATRLIVNHGSNDVARLTYCGLVVSIGFVMSAIWAYAALVAKIIHTDIGTRARWFFLLLMVVTPPLFLGLTMALPLHEPGLNPAFVAVLFLIGWRMRTWMVRRLGGHPHII